MAAVEGQNDSRIFSDLLEIDSDNRPRLLPGVHPLPDLLTLNAEEVLESFRKSQISDFTRVIQALEGEDNPLRRMFGEMRQIAEQDPSNRFNTLGLFEAGALQSMFTELHEHVMRHPVWRHPCFLRIFAGDFDRRQLESFALNYFNQVKNTRQCVALALSRFSGLISLPYGCLNERVSELAQIVLAQLLADEYGVGTHSIEEYPDLADLLKSTTHIGMYRQLLEGLAIPFERQDVPMLHGVADNVLIQRILAGHPEFNLVEALASVGLGMEWGVPEFFSLLLGGMIRWAWQHDVSFTQRHLIVFIAHVRYDVLHAISVMLATSLFGHEDDTMQRIKQATNMLMSGRYNMMSDLYHYLFGESCGGVSDIDLDARYHLSDRRIESALLAARRTVADSSLVDAATYKSASRVPFVFAD